MAAPIKGKNRVEAVAYLRTSSATNVGSDKDSEPRQRAAIDGFAKRNGFVIVDTYYDAAVSGGDPIETRAGFAALLDRIEGNGVRTVIVEDASRFARELMAQELGIALLIARGVRLLTASGDDLTASEDPTRKMLRQIAGAFAEYEKSRLVAKLRSGRARKLEQAGKCEGRLTRLARAKAANNKEEAARLEKVIAEVHRLRRASPKTGERRSLRQISAELAQAGHLNERGQPYSAKSVQAMLGQPNPKAPQPTE
jgi:DNA invertase Pin-like site-specific DNA recombinase